MSIQSTPKRKIIARKAPVAVAARSLRPASPAKPTLNSRLPLSPLTSNSSVASSVASTKKKTTKSPKQQKKRIRVRESCLPSQIRQHIQAARASENPTTILSALPESIRPPPSTTSSKRTVQKGTRRQIRVRDSLLPASVRQNRDRQLGLRSSPPEGVLAAPRRQVMLRTPPVGIRRVNKLSPTRRNMYEGGPPRMVHHNNM